jgi:hypothetical protein
MTMRARFLVVHAVALGAAAAAAGCALDDPPDVPSWQVDVMPVVAANCVRCHGDPLAAQVPTDFRLDAYGSTLFPGQTIPVKGASEYAVNLARVTDPDFASNFEERMPPNRTLDERSYRILRNWAGSADALTNIAPRGPGREGNLSPSINMYEVAREAAVVSLEFEVDDADHDLVNGVVLGPVVGPQGVTTRTVAIVVSGRRTVAWDTTGIPAGTYELTARLDDGADIDGPDGDEDYLEIPLAPVVLP